MTDGVSKYFVLRVYGAAGAIMKASEAVGHGAISPEAKTAILQAARLESGQTDARAADVFEGLSRDFADIAKTVRAVVADESRPQVRLADYPLTQKDLESIPAENKGYRNGFGGGFGEIETGSEYNLASAIHDAVRSETPLSMSNSTTIRGARKLDDGTYEAVLAVHHFMKPADDSDTHYLVRSDAKGNESCERCRIQTN